MLQNISRNKSKYGILPPQLLQLGYKRFHNVVKGRVGSFKAPAKRICQLIKTTKLIFISIVFIT